MSKFSSGGHPQGLWQVQKIEEDKLSILYIMIDNGYCDDVTNNGGCDFDSGDCCGANF